MIVKEQPKDKYDVFQGCDYQLKDKLVEIVDSYKQLFKEQKVYLQNEKYNMIYNYNLMLLFRTLACIVCQS